MKKINVTPTKNEQRALQIIMLDTRPCSSGCAFEEIQKKDIDCLQCPYMEAYYGLISKFNILDSLEEKTCE